MAAHARNPQSPALDGADEPSDQHAFRHPPRARNALDVLARGDGDRHGIEPRLPQLVDDGGADARSIHDEIGAPLKLRTVHEAAHMAHDCRVGSPEARPFQVAEVKIEPAGLEDGGGGEVLGTSCRCDDEANRARLSQAIDAFDSRCVLVPDGS